MLGLGFRVLENSDLSLGLPLQGVVRGIEGCRVFRNRGENGS